MKLIALGSGSHGVITLLILRFHNSSKTLVQEAFNRKHSLTPMVASWKSWIKVHVHVISDHEVSTNTLLSNAVAQVSETYCKLVTQSHHECHTITTIHVPWGRTPEVMWARRTPFYWRQGMPTPVRAPGLMPTCAPASADGPIKQPLSFSTHVPTS